MPILVTRAPAKINLTLHVLGRRAGDGYHELESLVAFTGAGDTLSLTPGNDGAPDDLALTVSGPTAGPAGPLDDNLVIRAARHLAARRPGLRLGAFHLVKRLPVAAGIGGGSSDAAAALRLLGRSNGLDPADPLLLEAARATGADVPVCLDPRARMMRGAGETLGPILGIAPLPAVLINPGIPVETAPVFRALGLAAGQRHRPEPHPEIPGGADGAAVLSLISPARNDLEAAARGLAPAIDVALQALAERAGCRLARMSGSGATVFGLFADRRTAVRAARHIRARHPGWWVKPTFLR